MCVKCNKPFKIIVILITLWSFLFNTVSHDLAYAATSMIPAQIDTYKSGGTGIAPLTFNIDNASVPFRFGEIKDSFRGSNGKTIIHIQDAHCNYSAQHSTEAIIKHLVATYNNVSLVSLEGGKGNYDLSIFTNIRDPEIRRRVSDYFVKEGRISGAEFFAINNPGTINLYGAEDGTLYVENLNAYRASLAYKEEVDRDLNSLSLAINNIKLKVYSPELKNSDEKIKAYRDNKIDFETYVAFLKEKAQANKIDINRYASLSSLAVILADEKSINFNDANRERNMLIDRLSQKLSAGDLEGLATKTVQFKQGDLTNEDFYSYLFKKARFAGVDFSKLPNLVKYSGYVNRYEAVDKAALSKDIADLEASIIGNITKTDDEKILYSLDKDLSIIRGMFNIALTKEDFDYYRANKEGFNVKHFVDFINRKAPLYGFNFKIGDEVMKMDAYRDNMEKFYVFSMKRDDAFIRNIENKLKAEKKNVTVLVTGGFHTGNLSKLLKEKGYSYVSVMPKFDKTDIENPYFKILSGGKSSIETIIESCISDIEVPAVLSEMGQLLFDMGITGARDRDLLRLSVDVMAALEGNPKEGIVLMVPGGYLRLTYEPETGSFNEEIGKINGKTLYAVRQESETLDPNFDNIVAFDRDQLGYEGHQAVIDLLFKMAHAPNETYGGLEAHSLSELLRLYAELNMKLTDRIGEENVKILLMLSDKQFGRSTRLIHIITGKDKTVIPWRIASYSDIYGVNVTYTGDADKFIDQLLHELNRAANPGLEHEANNIALTRVSAGGMLSKIDTRLRSLRGDFAAADMPAIAGKVENVTDDFAVAIASGAMSVSGAGDFKGLTATGVLDDIALTSKDDVAKAMAYSRLADHPFSEAVPRGGEAAIAALEDIAKTSKNDLTRSIANKRLVMFYSNETPAYWRAFDELESIVDIATDDAARALARGWFLEFYGSHSAYPDAINKYKYVLSDIFSQSEDDVAKVFAAISLNRDDKRPTYTDYLNGIASGTIPGSIRARAVALDYSVTHDNLWRNYLKGVYGYWLEDIVRVRVEGSSDRNPAKRKLPRGDFAAAEMPVAAGSIPGTMDGVNITDEVAIAIACDALLQSLGYDRSMESRQFESMDGSFDYAVKVLGWVTRTSADPLAKAIAYNALASIRQSGYEPDVSSGAIGELIAITNDSSVNDLAKAVANQKLVRHYSRLQEYGNREAAINKLKTIIEKSTDDAAKAIAIGELQKAYLEISLHNDKIRHIFSHSPDEVARVIAGTVLKEDGYLRGIISGKTPVSVRARTIAFAYFGSPFSGSEYSRGKNNRSKYYRDRSNSISYLNSIVVAKAQEVPSQGDAVNRNAITLPDYESITSASPSESRGDFAAAEMPIFAYQKLFEQDLAVATTALTDVTIKGYTPTLQSNKPGAIVMLMSSTQWDKAKTVIPGTRAAIEDLIKTRLAGQNIKIIIREDTEENRLKTAEELRDTPIARRIVFALTDEEGISRKYEDLSKWASPIMLKGKLGDNETLFVSVPKCLRTGLEGLNIQEVMSHDGMTIEDKQTAVDRFMNAIAAMGELDPDKMENMVKNIMENNGIHNVLLAVNIRPANINDIPAMEERTREVMRSL